MLQEQRALEHAEAQAMERNMTRRPRKERASTSTSAALENTTHARTFTTANACPYHRLLTHPYSPDPLASGEIGVPAYGQRLSTKGLSAKLKRRLGLRCRADVGGKG